MKKEDGIGFKLNFSIDLAVLVGHKLKKRKELLNFVQ